MSSSKFNIQNKLYDFPYHYIPQFRPDGGPTFVRKWVGGLVYLCYQTHIKQKVTNMNPDSVLEVGCGDGRFIGSLSVSIPRLVGIDPSGQAIAFAKAFNPHCEFYNVDIQTINMKFDVVTLIEVLEHIPEENIPKFFQKLDQSIKENGKIFISVPTTNKPFSKKHYRHYTSALLRNQIDASKSNLSILEEEYIFIKPWWFNLLSKMYDNKIFSLEIKAVTRHAWRRIWNTCKDATEKNGWHLVVTLGKTENK